jgi:hypothetical protein
MAHSQRYSSNVPLPRGWRTQRLPKQHSRLDLHTSPRRMHDRWPRLRVLPAGGGCVAGAGAAARAPRTVSACVCGQRQPACAAGCRIARGGCAAARPLLCPCAGAVPHQLRGGRRATKPVAHHTRRGRAPSWGSSRLPLRRSCCWRARCLSAAAPAQAPTDTRTHTRQHAARLLLSMVAQTQAQRLAATAEGTKRRMKVLWKHTLPAWDGHTQAARTVAAFDPFQSHRATAAVRVTCKALSGCVMAI